MSVIRHIRADAATWAANDIILPDGEIAICKLQGRVRLKVGDGVRPFSLLPYIDGNVSESAASGTLRTGDDIRLGAQGSVSIALPTAPEEDFYATVSFDSAQTPTVLTGLEGVYVTGDDCTLGSFSPTAGKHYTLLLWYDGRMQGLVRGVSLE